MSERVEVVIRVARVGEGERERQEGRGLGANTIRRGSALYMLSTGFVCVWSPTRRRVALITKPYFV